MNSSSSPLSRPRLVCRLVRSWCAVTESGSARHVASCPECRGYFQTENALDSALRVAAASAPHPAPSEGFERRLLFAVREAASARPAVHPRSRSRHAGAWAGIGATTAFAALLAITIARRPAPEVTAAEAAAIAATVKSFSNQLVEELIPSAGTMVANNPLQQELDSVYSDARSALGFLALNFLPSATERIAVPAPLKSRI